MMYDLSMTDQAMLAGLERGYALTAAGGVIGPSGRSLKLLINSVSGYFSFHVRFRGKDHSVTVHRLVAYCKYGDDLFDAECVRHLDGDPKNNSLDNIVIGTQKENVGDRTAEERSTAAVEGSRKRRKLTDDQVRSIRFWHGKIHPYTGVRLTHSEISRIYNVSRPVIRLLINRLSYKDVA